MDQTLFEVALRNLIDNAIKYSPNESEILIETRLVENKSYEVEIINQTSQPIKLNSNVLTKNLLEEKNNQNVIGTGLGLAIVSEAIAIALFHLFKKRIIKFAQFYHFISLIIINFSA